ncbi:hypothetical protein TNCV_3715621 [Trichonephila clavipes]|nr:hypothetical protein TNCV_3715621 [Trichonephila clavipes]
MKENQPVRQQSRVNDDSTIWLGSTPILRDGQVGEGPNSRKDLAAYPVLWLVTLTAVLNGLGSNPVEGMDWKGKKGVKLLITPQSVLPQNWGGTEQNRTVTSMVLKAKANDRRKNLALRHDEFRGP